MNKKARIKSTSEVPFPTSESLAPPADSAATKVDNIMRGLRTTADLQVNVHLATDQPGTHVLSLKMYLETTKLDLQTLSREKGVMKALSRILILSDEVFYSAVDPDTDRIFIQAHRYTTGFEVSTTPVGPSDLPRPFKQDVHGYVIDDGPDHVKLAFSEADALSGVAGNIIDQGTGSFILEAILKDLGLGVDTAIDAAIAEAEKLTSTKSLESTCTVLEMSALRTEMANIRSLIAAPTAST